MVEFANQVIKNIWEDRYQKNGETLEHNFERVAKFCSNNEIEEAEFLNLLSRGLFFPAGRTMSNSGIGHALTLNNCFVAPKIEDSLEDIFDKVALGARTHQRGGGIGYDFSNIRPKGSPTSNDAVASGAVSFMDVFNAQTATILQGNRRGANMGVMNIYSIDIEEFVTAKAYNKDKLNHFNLSVMVDDKFVNAVKNNENIFLHFPVYTEEGLIEENPDNWLYSKKINAKCLWDLITKTAYDNGEPGIFFFDNMNKDNNIWYAERIVASNPCSEYLAGTVYNGCLPASEYGGACNLGSLMLHRFVAQAFTENAHIQEDLLEEAIFIAVRMLDNIIDKNTFPDPIYENYQKTFRTIGLGVTGFADALTMLNLKYDSKEAEEFADYIFDFIARKTYLASCKLAKNKGAFPGFDRKKFVQSGYIQKHLKNDISGEWHNIVSDILEDGIRNAKMLSVAPCGTMSLTFGNNCSSGIEPIFQLEYKRKVKFGGQSDDNVEVVSMIDPAYEYWRGFESKHNIVTEEKFVTALDMSVDSHVSMLGVIAKHIDMSVSKTINIPNDYPFEDTQNVYMKAHDLGIKGCTIFRPNELRQGILITNNSTPEHSESISPYDLPRGVIIATSDDCIGKKRRLVTGCVDGNTEFFNGQKWKKISDYEDGDLVLQYNQDGSASLVEPIDYIKRKSNGQYHIKSYYGLDMMVSPDHRNVVFSPFRNNMSILTTQEIVDQHNRLRHGFYKRFKTSFVYDGAGINLTDDEIRIEVAIFADGCFYSDTSKKCLVSVRKKRKRDRLIELLNSADIQYSENIDSDGYYNIKFYPPLEGRVKQYPSDWYNCSQHQLQVIFDEVFLWDGCYSNKNEYSTVIKSNADFIQFVCAATNHRASLYTDSRNEKYSDHCYRVDWNNRVYCGIVEKDKKEIEFIDNVDYDYCFSVPSTMLVLRRNDKIFITGNCGSLHCTAWFDPWDGSLLEVFLDKGSTGGCERNLQALSRMISLAARGGIEIHAICDQLMSVGGCTSYCVRSATKHDTSKGTSCAGAVANALLDMWGEVQEEIYADEDETATIYANEKPVKTVTKAVDKSLWDGVHYCPDCGAELQHIGGCIQCSECPWSKCN